jgi:acetyl esterase
VKINFFTYLRFIILLVRLKLLNLFSCFPPLPGGILDEQTSLLRRCQELLGEIPLDETTPEQARLDFHHSFSLLKGIGATFEIVDSIQDLTIPGIAVEIPARLYLPDKKSGHPLFVLLHGGGWVIGDLDTADNMARFLCKHVPCVVLSVDYRLAPEYPFPAAVEDSFSAIQWAAAHAVELGGNPQRVLVGGDSAGGNLAAVMAQEFGERSLGLPRRDVEWFLEQYTPNPQNRLDPRVSPLLADDLSGLPPTLVVTAEFDVLRDEGEAYARRLEKAGVKVSLMRCNGMVHGFLSMIGLIRWANLCFEQITVEIRKMVET